MCFSLDAEPPTPPISGGAVRGEELVLTSPDGTKFNAYAGHVLAGATPPRSGIVILPDVRGLYRFYRDLALRFASAGVESVAIDYFGRTAGLTPRDDDFDFWPHVQQTRPETWRPMLRPPWPTCARRQARRSGPSSPSASASVAATRSSRRRTSLVLPA